MSAVELEAQQVSQGRGPGLGELEQLREDLHAVTLDMTTTEAFKDHLGNTSRESASMTVQLRRSSKHSNQLGFVTTSGCSVSYS